ncbi:putative F-box protein At5g55150 [Silene latifolia]|uniref:putative F-box protein At5g55150 n=1 Tax=Silene latifolia TaxID=37657 RepID=UPI003D77AB95
MVSCSPSTASVTMTVSIGLEGSSSSLFWVTSVLEVDAAVVGSVASREESVAVVLRVPPDLPETFEARCWGSSYGWVAMIDLNFDVQLFNPITKAQTPFPSLKPFYDGDEFDQNGESHQHWFLHGFAERLIVLKVPQNNNYEFVVLVVYEYYRSLAFARQGDQSWTPVFVNSKFGMCDVVGMDDKVFALYRDGSIVSWNVEEFNALELIKPADYSPFGHGFLVEFNKWGLNNTYFVRSGSDLLAVLRYRNSYRKEFDTEDDTDYDDEDEDDADHDDDTDHDDQDDTNYDDEDEGDKDDTDYNDEDEDDVDHENKGDSDYFCRTKDFKVYRFKSEDKSWEKIEDLGGVALVVGGNSSMCVSVAHANGLQRNCIYFTDDLDLCWLSLTKPGGHDTGVFDLKNGNIRRFYEGDDMHSSFSPPILFIPQF